MAGVWDGVESDGEAQEVGLAGDAADHTFGVVLAEVVAAEVVVAGVVGEHLQDSRQDGVFDGASGTDSSRIRWPMRSRSLILFLFNERPAT